MRVRWPAKLWFWCLALVIGAAAGFAALLFRLSIDRLTLLVYGTDGRTLATVLNGLPWWWLITVPVVGGLVVGLILDRFTPNGSVHTVADVIEGAALNGGRVAVKEGVASAVASLITVSTGGSTGREGPVVHLAATISTWVCVRLRCDGVTGRDLLGCAVAGAVSASFNAPIAGALFALEVVLRHFALNAFAPIVIASVAGTVINRLEFGGVTEFVLPEPGSLDFYVELPAFLVLGLVSGLIAIALMLAVFWAEDVGTYITRRTGMKRWLRPAFAGLLMGLVAIWFPHVIGVGYQTTASALTGQLTFHDAVLFAVIKCVAVAITFGGRMGGGVFSPSLMVGALSGLAFGMVATSIFPHVSGSETLYALAGMGAVAAAVLGAPISTTLIVFELTGDWQTGLAVMTAVSLSTALASRVVERSFFLTQLERRGVRLSAGPQAYLLATVPVSEVLRKRSYPGAPFPPESAALIGAGQSVAPGATLEQAMVLFQPDSADYLPVIAAPAQGVGPPVYVGTLYRADAFMAYANMLAATAAEEHR
ncbi:chloride channel protein [Pseudoruegeria sp. SK021]|uniref:chloride channel protein n=1 Tax=Pseudoruegeria sp. SK021 TaxID=1933035 RepID=UPI000A22DC22|nr:chloride channel protein [Pseudoruegeria sp. SK021]OSP55008.1 voltage-gated chloride channel [Pseudoruegeria sp. SK021]